MKSHCGHFLSKNALTEQFFTDLGPDQDGAHTLVADLVGGHLNKGG